MRPLLLLLAILLCAAAPARAAARLDLGADYVLDGGPGIFSLTLSAETALSRAIAFGGRAGGLITTDPTQGGVPIDLYLRLVPARSGVYFQALGGPWIFFSDALRAHFGFGFGAITRNFELGGEVGWLSGVSRAMLGVRLGFRI